MIVSFTMKNLFRRLIKICGLISVIFFIPINYSQADNYNLFVSLSPNDLYLNQQYYLGQIKAQEAWDIVKDSPNVVVAVIDSGVDIEHPDLADNIWRNPKEISNDKIDNDNNGYVDDIYGWDFILNSNDPKPKFGGRYTNLGINHGTIVAGVIGALANNNFGISGIAWKIKIMPLRVMDGEGAGSTDLVYKAIRYAIDNKADIINLSMVGKTYDPLLDEIIKDAYQRGIIIVTAAGNETAGDSNSDLSLNLGEHPEYPICHDGSTGENYVLGVGSVDYLDKKSEFSNYGSKCLDLVAPGESFYGTLFFSPVMSQFNKYFGGYWSGTSLAAPQVAATAALVKAIRPDLTNKEIYNLIINNTDNIDDKNPDYKNLLGSGRLNLYKAITAAESMSIKRSDIIVSPMGQRLPTVEFLNYLGQKNSDFLAYKENFLGGVNIASADVDFDGLKEIITGAGSGGGPHIRIFKQNGELIGQFFAYNINFTGGVNVVGGDIDGDNQTEIIAAPQGNYLPEVKIFDARGNFKKSFIAFDNNFKGGVNLALSDINADGTQEIVTAQGPGDKPLVRIFNQNGLLLKEFLAYDPVFKGGVKVSSVNLFGDLRTEILTVPQSDYFCQIRVFSPSGDIIKQWLGWEVDYNVGCNIASGNIDEDSGLEVIASQAKNGNSEIKVFSQEGDLKSKFSAFENNFKGGVNIFVK